MNKPYFCRIFFLTDWRHKRLKNKMDLLLFYREHFYGFSESERCLRDIRVFDRATIRLRGPDRQVVTTMKARENPESKWRLERTAWHVLSVNSFDS